MFILLVVPAIADENVTAPQLPHIFYGIVDVGASPAGQGLTVEARGPGVRTIGDNPVKTLADGSYGTANITVQGLVVQGNIEAGTSLEFYVNGVRAEVNDVETGNVWNTTYPYTSGDVTHLNLRIDSLPAAGQIQIPTSVQTQVSSGSGSSGGGGGGGYTGPGLAQPSVVETYIPGESTGNQSSVGNISQEPVTTVTAPTQSGEPSTTEVQNIPTTIAPVLPVNAGNTGLLLAVGVVIVIAILGGIFYYMRCKQTGDEKKEG